MASFIFERKGIEIIFEKTGVTLKKNGLTIFVPAGVIDECLAEYQIVLDEENMTLLNQLRSYTRE